jgi:hypothetical protein
LVGERLIFRPRLSERDGEVKPVILPTPALAVIWLAAPDGADRTDVLRRRLATGKRTRDTVYLRNGDTVEGVLADLDEKTVQVEVAKRTVDLPRDRVAAVALGTELASSLRPKGAYGRLVFANGNRLSLLSAICPDGRTLTGVTLFQAPVSVPLDEVIALSIEQGKAVYLSDLKPRDYEYTSYLPTALAAGLASDGGFGGRDLRVAGNTHDKGLGLRSASRVTYDIGGKYRQFEALVGLDDHTGLKGSARVGVLVDGKPQDLGIKQDLTANNGPLPVSINVAGARELTLLVEYGQGGDVQDNVNWLDARLIK